MNSSSFIILRLVGLERFLACNAIRPRNYLRVMFSENCWVQHEDMSVKSIINNRTNNKYVWHLLPAYKLHDKVIVTIRSTLLKSISRVQLSPRAHPRRSFSLHKKLIGGKPERVSEQHSMKIDEQWECWTLCVIKIEGTYRGGEGTTPVTTSCPEDRWGYGLVRVELESKSDDKKKTKLLI